MTKKFTPTGKLNGIIDDDIIEQAKKERSDVARPSAKIPVNNSNPGNIQDGTTTAAGVLRGIGFVPKPNPLGDLFQPTYHFSFYLDGEFPEERGQAPFVIAETGMTGMNIQEVNIDSVVGPNQRTKNAMTTNITIRIYEPYGAMLPDLLYQAAVTKGIRNYLKAPWFLKLHLHGYDNEGKVVKVGDGWTWMMSLIDVASQVSSSGSMHTITAMPLSEQAFNDQYCMLAQGSQATGTTVGEILENVIKGMNSSVEKRYGAGGKPLLEFEVKFKDYPYDTKVGVTNPSQHQVTGSIATLGDQAGNAGFDVQTGHFSPGTDFPAIVDMVMSKSDTAIMMARNSRQLPPSTGNDDESVIKDVSSILHRIDTQVEYRDYDYVAGDYAKKITYIVKPYTSMRLLTSMGRAQKFDKSPKLNKAKASFAVQQSYMQKQYDYLFTGMNTEVEKFDINLNFNWAIQVPQFQGQNTFTGTASQIDLTKNVQALQADLTTKNAELDKKNADFSQYKNEDGTDKTLTAEQAKKKEEDNQQIVNLTKERDALSSVVGAKRAEFNNMMNERRNQQLARRPLPTSAIYNGEDLVYENVQNADYGGAAQNAQSFMPITIVQDSAKPGIRTSQGMGNDNNPHRSVYGSLLNQLYGTTIDGNLQSLDLEIRGDPYWLGPGDNGIPFDQPSTDRTPNFNNGEHMFVFRFKLPLGYDSKTGTVSVSKDQVSKPTGIGDNVNSSQLGSDSNIFTGFFACIEVNNKFQEGKFTQVLKASRIPGWEYENIIEGRETSVNEDTTFDNSPGPNKPPTAIYGGGRNAGATVPGIGAGNINERQLLALTLVEEAGGEGPKGMQAVGNVIANRARAGIRGNTVSQVITSPSQFSAWNAQGSIQRSAQRRAGTPIYNQAYDIAGKILDGSASDITNGATDYYAPAKVTPSWANVYKQTAVIGNHRFMRR